MSQNNSEHAFVIKVAAAMSVPILFFLSAFYVEVKSIGKTTVIMSSDLAVGIATIKNNSIRLDKHDERFVKVENDGNRLNGLIINLDTRVGYLEKGK